MQAHVALVGVGCWGKHLARNLHELGALACIVESDEDKAKALRQQYPSVLVSTDLSEALSKPEIKACCLATPAITHFELGMQILERGKDLYVEKPLCLTVADGQRLVDLAERQGRVLMGGHLLQYHPHFMALHKLVKSGQLGDLLYISAHRLDLGRFRFEENALWNFAPHDFSLILALCGDQLPEQVRCHGQRCLSAEVEDNNIVDLVFPGRLRAHVYVSWISPFKEQKLTVFGTQGMAIFDDTAEWDCKLQLFLGQLSYQDGEPILERKTAESVVVARQEPLRAELQHFLDCVKERSTPRTGPQENLRVLATLEASQRSLDLGGIAQTPSLLQAASS